MRRVQTPLALALLFEGLFVLAFAWAVLVGGPIDFLYRSAAGLSTVRSVAQDAAILAGIGLFIAAAIVAIFAAFQPTSRFGRVLHVLPVYALGVTFLIGVASLLQVGTTGTLADVGGAQLTLSTAGIIVGVALSTIAVAIAAGRLHLSTRTLRSVTTMATITIVPVVVSAVALVAAVVIVSSTTPSFSFGGPGGPGGQPGGAGGRNTPGGSATQAAAGGNAGQNGPGGAPAGGGTQAAGGNAGQNAPGGAPGGQAAPDGVSTREAASGSAAQNGPGLSGTQAAAGGNASPGGAGGGQGGNGPGGGRGGPGGGGPGGGFTSFVGTYRTTGIAAAVFALIALISAFTAFRGTRSLPAEQSAAQAPKVNYGRELGSVVVSVIGISVAILVVIQAVPVSRTNPPVQTTPNWDSPQTETLFMNACADCHSNLTKWPWYSYIAPSSWLQAVHVQNARSEFDISELNKLPTFLKSMMANNVKMHLDDKSMPPADYLLLHPEARLTDAERQQLIDGMRATLSKS